MPSSPNAPSGPGLHASHVLFPLPGTPCPTLHRGEPHSALLSPTHEAGSDARLSTANLAFLWAFLLPSWLWSAGSLPTVTPGGAWRAMCVILSEVLAGTGLRVSLAECWLNGSLVPGAQS